MTIFKYILTSGLVVLTVADKVVVQTEFYKDFNVSCPQDYELANSTSEYARYGFDRRWIFDCRPVPENTAFGECFHGSTNFAYGKDTSFDCHDTNNQSVIRSFAGMYTRTHKDRIYDYSCCSLIGRIIVRCMTLGRSSLQANFTDTFPANWLAVGLITEYFRNFRDRKYRVKVSETKRV